mmetsp:Transcript_7683/g.12911  ORF Transcript_7683/g.12911 Transcript_7683/m.12911 type:complete len:286 (-) Transcript_7683:359-1216(-)
MTTFPLDPTSSRPDPLETSRNSVSPLVSSGTPTPSASSQASRSSTAGPRMTDTALALPSAPSAPMPSSSSSPPEVVAFSSTVLADLSASSLWTPEKPLPLLSRSVTSRSPSTLLPLEPLRSPRSPSTPLTFSSTTSVTLLTFRSTSLTPAIALPRSLPSMPTPSVTDNGLPRAKSPLTIPPALPPPPPSPSQAPTSSPGPLATVSPSTSKSPSLSPSLAFPRSCARVPCRLEPSSPSLRSSRSTAVTRSTTSSSLAFLPPPPTNSLMVFLLLPLRPSVPFLLDSL